MALLVMYGQRSEQSTAESSYHQEMYTFMNVVRSQRHDYNLHVQTVASLIAQNKWEECRSYVNALVRDTSDMNTVLTVTDPAVAALIHNFRILAAQNGILLDLMICNDMTNVVTNAYETNKIIGNLLQNALVELIPRPEKGKIELGILKRGEFCLVHCEDGQEYKANYSMDKLQEMLEGYGFFRTYQSYLVPVDRIRQLQSSKFGSSYEAYLDDGTVVPVSRGKYAKLKEFIMQRSLRL